MKLDMNHNHKFSKIDFKRQIYILISLLKRDLIEFKNDIKNNLFDAILWPIKSIILYSYFLPAFGLSGRFGEFIVVGTVIIISFLNIFDFVNRFLRDINEVGYIDYELTLPISSFLIFFKRIILFTLRALVISFTVYTIGVILLKGQFSGVPFSLYKSFIMLLIINLVFGALALLITSITRSKNIFHSFFSTLLFSGSDFGCYAYAWKTLYFKAPLFAYFILINPLTYGMEGMRSAVLGPQNYLNYWICIMLLILAFSTFFTLAIKKLKYKLDCI